MKGKTFWVRELIFILGFCILHELEMMKTDALSDYFHLDYKVCPGQTITLSINELENLRNCSKIEGYLEIARIEYTESYSEFDAYSFPNLREITGHLMLYRVDKLRSLSQLFPNLSVIRGETLFDNYALIVYEIQDLEEIGLTSLAKILAGGVRIAKNPSLCYVDTIKWRHIVTREAEIHFPENKSPGNCIEMCPRDSNRSDICPSEEVIADGKALLQPRCWNSKHCQKMCPLACNNSACYVEGGEYKCCHSECLGGCIGPTDKECDACAHVIHNNTCLPQCPEGTLKFLGRWCLAEEECKGGMEWYENGRRLKVHDGRCFPRCPTGFMRHPNVSHLCVVCDGQCIKDCRSLKIDSISSAQMAKDCKIINGSLEIDISGSLTAYNLEENLGMIEEVTEYVRIFQAHSLISLRFLKNLRVIHGNKPYSERYSLLILDNQHLQDIWDFSDHVNLTIKKGELFIHANRKLCFSIIENFVQSVGKNLSDIGENEISRSSNGDNIPCLVHPLAVNVGNIEPRSAILQWMMVNISDPRLLLGHMIYYRKVQEKENVTMYSQRDACESDIWTSEYSKIDGQPMLLLYMLQQLEPFTKYAVYVQTYSVSKARDMFRSEFIYFYTKTESPTKPRNLVFFSKDPNELHIKWSPPSFPHGIVTHYYVYWNPTKFDASDLLEKDFCAGELPFSKSVETNSPSENATSKELSNENCCTCQSDKGKILDREITNLERKYDIRIQNNLQNRIYIKKNLTGHKRSKRQSLLSYNLDTTPDNSSDNSSGEQVMSAIVYNETEILLTNLHHNQEYSVDVIACHDYIGDHKLCSPKLFGKGMTIKKNSADDIDESGVFYTLNNATELFITWPPPAQPNRVIILYEIQLDDRLHEQVRTSCVPLKMYSLRGGHVIRGLTTGNWSFKIRATSLAGAGSWTKSFYVSVPSTSSQNMLMNVAAPMVAILLAICIVCVLSYVYVQRKRLRDSKLRVSNNPSYLLTEDVYTPDEWEVERSNVTREKELGSGSFGKVYEGTVKNLDGMPSSMKVAIKTTHDVATRSDVICFLNEASRMKVFKNGCNHVVKLYGVVSIGRPPYVIMELMSKGDLRDYLRSCRSDSHGNEARSPLTLDEMLKMAAEIADGMAFLESKNFVHRDLASRNCLVSDDMVVKIADFGMTRDIYISDYYRKGSVGMLPVRWMPKESIDDGYFDHKSDVWSYGVVLWEILTLGNQPYMGLTNEQVCHYVTSGGCLNQPEGCHPILANLMTNCWKGNPKLRISFGEILIHLKPHLPQEFINKSFYFTFSINSTRLKDDTTSDATSYMPIKNVPSIEDHHDETALINNCASQPELKTFNNRGFPMPVTVPAANHDEYIFADSTTKYSSSDSGVSVTSPYYVNTTHQRL